MWHFNAQCQLDLWINNCLPEHFWNQLNGRQYGVFSLFLEVQKSSLKREIILVFCSFSPHSVCQKYQLDKKMQIKLKLNYCILWTVVKKNNYFHYFKVRPRPLNFETFEISLSGTLQKSLNFTHYTTETPLDAFIWAWGRIAWMNTYAIKGLEKTVVKVNVFHSSFKSGLCCVCFSKMHYIPINRGPKGL